MNAIPYICCAGACLLLLSVAIHFRFALQESERKRLEQKPLVDDCLANIEKSNGLLSQATDMLAKQNKELEIRAAIIRQYEIREKVLLSNR